MIEPVSVILSLAFLDFVEFFLFVLMIVVVFVVFARFGHKPESYWELFVVGIVVVFCYQMAVSPILSWEDSLVNLLIVLVDNTILKFFGLGG